MSFTLVSFHEIKKNDRNRTYSRYYLPNSSTFFFEKEMYNNRLVVDMDIRSDSMR